MHPNDTAHTCAECQTLFAPRSGDPGRYCSRACYSTARRKRAEATREQRFWSYVDQGGECWLWTRSTRGEGYGQFCVGHGFAGPAHRFAWEFATGEILTPEDVIGHTCDNRPCVRNDDAGFYEVGGIALPRRGHLFKGAQIHNVTDMIAKGRVSLVGRLDPRGAANPKAKLTDALVRDMRQRVSRGNTTTKTLAAEYGIHVSTVRRIISRQIWPHVE